MKDKTKPSGEEKIEMYKICVECRNCGRPDYTTDEAYTIEVPKGIEISTVLKEMPCKFCNCKTLGRAKNL